MSRTKTAVAEKPVASTRKSSTRKAKNETSSVPESVTESVPETVPETVSESATDDSSKKSRQAPSRDSVETEFNELVAVIELEISHLRETASKSKGVKFLRSLNKRVKTLRTHTLRVTRQRKSSSRKNNSNSGFLKPVKISAELAKFTGWNPTEERSRVEVTKYICNYIKENNLQNPQDKRQIRVDDDPKLKKLLKYDAKKDTAPLTYYSLQTYLKDHFTATTPVVAPTPGVSSTTPVVSSSTLVVSTPVETASKSRSVRK